MLQVDVPEGRPCPSYIGRQTRSVDRSPGRLQQGNLSLVCLHHGKLIRATLIRPDCLVLYAKLSSRLDKVVWGIFWKVFRRSCGPPTRSVGPTNRSASLLVGRTYLSGTAVSLVGGDPGVPMSHKFKEVWYLDSVKEYPPLKFPDLQNVLNWSVSCRFCSQKFNLLVFLIGIADHAGPLVQYFLFTKNNLLVFLIGIADHAGPLVMQ
jgi:hypothetical protein